MSIVQQIDEKMRILNRAKKYGYYQDKEYKVAGLGNRKFRLISTDVADLKKNFDETNPNVFVRVVDYADIDYGYEIVPKAFYKGIRYSILGWDDIVLVLFSTEKLNSKSTPFERNGYRTDIDLNDEDLFLTYMEIDVFDLPSKPDKST